MKKIRFSIVGCGIISKDHANAVINDERAELAAVCDVSEIKAKALASDYNIESGGIYTDFEEMLKRNDIDAVCVCTPSGLHGTYAIPAAKAKKHVLCEKPLDIDSEVITEMIRTAEENNVKLACIFQNRTRKGLKRAKEILESGELGKMTIVECQYRGYRSPQYYGSAQWRGKWELDGGGCLMNQGVHAVDTMCWLAGDVESIYAETAHLLRDIEVEDTAAAVLRFQNGASGVIMGTTISNVPEIDAPEGDIIRIECEKGTIVYTKGKTALYLREQDNVREISLEEDPAANTVSDGAEDGHSILVKDLVSAILEGRDPYITARSARKSVDVILGIYESSRSGRKIYL